MDQGKQMKFILDDHLPSGWASEKFSGYHLAMVDAISKEQSMIVIRFFPEHRTSNDPSFLQIRLDLRNEKHAIMELIPFVEREKRFPKMLESFCRKEDKG